MVVLTVVSMILLVLAVIFTLLLSLAFAFVGRDMDHARAAAITGFCAMLYFAAWAVASIASSTAVIAVMGMAKP